ncbi:LAFE_0E08328g1_1 [Lachancea fermentati]|uniref:LAFE_0E08328g1_1 n=1 Tax=Lachancea fermentati TaxID=4955 RepID=A0A1G4MD84_LACFM|nr:LAFE_0E08328g1_1 [Lachancea fermentati]
MSKQTVLDRELHRLLKSHTQTTLSETQEQIEANHAYITSKQLKKLIDLHDLTFQERCVIPLQKLYDKHMALRLMDGDLQNWAEVVDRDIRVLETTLQLVKEGRQET